MLKLENKAFNCTEHRYVYSTITDICNTAVEERNRKWQILKHKAIFILHLLQKGGSNIIYTLWKAILFKYIIGNVSNQKHTLIVIIGMPKR